MGAICPVCSSQNVGREPFRYRWLERDWWLERCRDCTHQFIFPHITHEEQAIIFSDTYFAKDGDWSCGVLNGSYQDAESELKAEAAEVLAMLPLKSGNLLDIGCAGGRFLAEANRNGFSVCGIEYNASMAEHARGLLGDDKVVQESIDNLGKEWKVQEFDVITLMDVLEHLPYPGRVMEKASAWAKPGGYLFVRGPLVNSVAVQMKETARRLLGRTKTLDGYPLDANCFNKRSLTRLLELHGFRVVSWLNETPSFANMLARKH